jgi:hypothetical protein
VPVVDLSECVDAPNWPNFACMASDVSDTHRRDFIIYSESTVSPREVGRLHGRAEMLARLPQSVQRWIVAHAPADPLVGFIVEPYALFLAYEIADEASAQALLPAGYQLVPTSMFADGPPRNIGIVGAFNVHSSVFWGTRVEFYVIAMDTRTGMLTWVICDYESNTINYDPGEGFSPSTTSRAVVTSSHRGEVIVDVRSKDASNQLSATADLPRATMRPLDQRLWIDGNLSITYGGHLMSPSGQPFGLVFDPAEMEQALDLPLDAVIVDVNTFGAGILAEEPFEVACFPYAQHFLTPSYPRPSDIHDAAGLAAAVRSLAEERH